ncbi:energy transducer TonB [Massilia rhizosphaerae]|uniref:energy transducer TonB n=1 Tax=Massilia rhizosphaerae TaxID=2784389 RepID=UPI0018DBB454|nr:energy transducer TonB [Massilia rhizosphaerae]
MSRFARFFRTALHCLPFAVACAAPAHAATPPQTVRPTLDFASCAKPQYPHADLQAGHQGKVQLGFLVDENGRVQESKVEASSGFATLDEAARTALARCSFHAGQENGKPVRQWTSVRYVWKMH